MFKKKIIAVLVLAVFSALYAGCSRQPKFEDAFKTYASNWSKENFKAMYAQLSADTKKNISEDNFVQRYTNIYDGIGASKITITPKITEKMKPDKNNKISIPFDMSMETAAGTVKFSHNAGMVLEKQNNKSEWHIVWNEQMIFPQMDPGDKVRFNLSEAQRGELLDRNGKELAANGTVQSVGVVPGKLGNDKETSKSKIASILGIAVDQIDSLLNQKWVKDDLFVPIAKIPENDGRTDDLLKIPGVKITNVKARVYPYKEAMAQLIGWVGNISGDELKKLNSEGYTDSDIIGKAGLEQIFEKRLRGKNGGEIWIEGSDNSRKQTIIKTEPQNGEDIKLTIDANMQDALYKQLSPDAGDAAAINPKTGEVLALVSSPSYDPNQLVLGISQSRWKALNDDPKKPLMNRFAQVYAPGSTFKAITAGIGLKTGKINPDEKINIQGLTWQKDKSWGDYYVKRVSDPKRPVNLKDALVYSDNIYFAMSALKIGGKPMIDGAASFGIGEDIPFEYPIKKSMITEGNFQNDIQLADTGYGQGKVETSTLHLALIYSSLINNGNILKPALELKEGGTPQVWHEGAIPKDKAEIILNDLIQVVEDSKGTARECRIPNVSIAAKTGTAELKADKNDKEAKENGWFVALNTDNPRLAVSMMIEDVGARGGSHYVVPKVKNVLTGFLK